MPTDLLQATLQVSMSETNIDYNTGAQLATRYSLLIDGVPYELVPDKDIEIVGLFNDSLHFLGGEPFLVDGSRRNGHIEVSYLQYLHPGNDPELVYAFRNNGSTLLINAVQNCHERKPDLSQIGLAEINKRDWRGLTPIALAAALNCSSTFHALLDAGADLALGDITRGTLLHHAMRSTPDLELFERVMGLVDNVNAQDFVGATPLHIAIANTNATVVRQLLDAGADVNAIGSDGTTCLHVAAARGDTEIVMMLFDAGANYLAVDDYGRTPVDLLNDDARARLIEHMQSRTSSD